MPGMSPRIWKMEGMPVEEWNGSASLKSHETRV